MLDDDLDPMGRDALAAEVRRLRAGIRENRDSSGHGLCWHHPQLWNLLPEPVEPHIAVPPWPKFLRGCVHYRESLDRQAPDAPVLDEEYDGERITNAAVALWRRVDMPGHDAAMLDRVADGWVLTGYAAFGENGPTGVRYRVDLASDFRSRQARIEGFRAGRPFHHLFRRAEGRWWLDGAAVHGLDDLDHLDFGFTPSTNLQQLRHADLAVGEDADIEAAWFDIGGTTLVRLPQHYRRLSEVRYHYESPTASYAAVLELAPDGFVRLYPDLWEMER